MSRSQLKTALAQAQEAELGIAGGRYHVAALARGLLLLQALAEARAPLGLAALQERTDLSKSTLVRLLSVLAEEKYVVRVNEVPTYWLGPAVMPLGEAYTEALDVSACAERVLRALSAATRQTSNVAILDGTDVVHLCVVEPDRPIRFRASTGFREGAYQTGLGKLLLAYTDPASLADHLPPEPFAARTRRTLTTRRALAAELDLVRRNGFAFDDEESDDGVRCLAVPIRNHPDVVAAVSVTGPAAELRAEMHAQLLASLRDAAADLEKEAQFQHAVQIAHRLLKNHPTARSR